MALLVHDTKQGQLVEAYVVHLLYKQLQVPWQWILLLGSMAQKLVQPLEWLIVDLETGAEVSPSRRHIWTSSAATNRKEE
jgi:hypothetical protein